MVTTVVHKKDIHEPEDLYQIMQGLFTAITMTPTSRGSACQKRSADCEQTVKTPKVNQTYVLIVEGGNQSVNSITGCDSRIVRLIYLSRTINYP